MPLRRKGKSPGHSLSSQHGCDLPDIARSLPSQGLLRSLEKLRQPLRRNWRPLHGLLHSCHRKRDPLLRWLASLAAFVQPSARLPPSGMRNTPGGMRSVRAVTWFAPTLKRNALTFARFTPTLTWFVPTFQKNPIFHVKIRANPVKGIVFSVKVCSDPAKDNHFPRQDQGKPRQVCSHPSKVNHYPRQGLLLPFKGKSFSAERFCHPSTLPCLSLSRL